MIRNFIGEDDLGTFEGWLKYQVGDAASTSPDQIALWRDLYDEVTERGASTPKAGLMKLKPGEHRYAVAVRDDAELWLALWVRRSPKSDIYVLLPRGDRGWNPHTSYHRDGTLFQKSHDNKFGMQQRQPLIGSFHGTEHLGEYAGYGPKGVGAICDPNDFSGVIEIGPGILGPIHGRVAVDLVEPGCEPMDLLMFGFQEVARQEFRDAIPNVVIRVLASK